MKTLALIWGIDIPSIQNRAPFQRAASLADEYDCVVYTWTHGTIPDGVEIPEESVHICPGGPVLSRLLFPFWLLYNLVLIRKTKVDAVHTSYHLLPIFSGYLCSLAGKTWIMDIWDHPRLSLEFKQGLLLMIYQFAYPLAIRCIRQADLIVISLHPEFAWKQGLPEEKVVTLTNGTELSLYQDVIAHNEEDFNVVYVGYVLKERGIDTLVDAIADLQTRMPQYTVTLIGPIASKDEQWLQRRLRDEGITDTVNIMGELSHEETLRNIAAADICLFPFPRKQVLEYIFPIKIFEYMALGKAIVSSDLKGASQILEHGETALLVEPGDPSAWANAIQRLHNDKEFRVEIGQEARQTVEQYDWSKINQELIAAINVHLTSSN